VPYLVIVIDEFRILVDEAPAALAELMRIAAVGRSLGIQLIMATQRPQGAVNADIRANVTSSIALRVQTGPESMDVMGSGLAAAIPIARPGRAFLVRGNQAPEEFQTATLASGTAPRTTGAVTVRTVADALARPHPEVSPAVASPGAGGSAGSQIDERSTAPVGAQGPASLIALVADLWHKRGGQPLRRPVADPLPTMLRSLEPGPPDPDTGLGTDRAMVQLGRVDLPELQRVAALVWSPLEHGHLGLVGTGAGGRDAAVALAVSQLLTGGVESHLYILDATGSFSTASAASRVGAVVGLQELRRAARVLQRVAEEATARLGVPASTPRPPLVLVLSGWGAWVSGFRSGPFAWAEDLVHDIVRDGSRAGITVLVSGERELVTARFFAALPNRIYFPAGSTEEARLAWPRLPTLEQIPGRVAVFGPFVPASLAAGHAAQLLEPQSAAGRCPAEGAVSTVPFRVEALPALVTVGEVLARCGVRGRDRGPRGGKSPPDATITGVPGESGAPVPATALLIGVAGDELNPHGLLLPAGGVLAVLGGPGSGKSTLLAALPAMNPAETWLAPPAGTDPATYWSGAHASALAGTLERRAIALADDADLLPHEANSSLAALNSLGWRVIVAAGFGPAFGERVALAPMVRSQGRAVLIRPRGFLDGDLFGVRFETEPSPPAGRAIVLFDGHATPVQLAALPDGQ
jgi:S-DNA-T family DNA segregation ATPase FtsK/SpoIIIE